LTPPRLEIRNITCRFGGRDVVRDVTLSVEAGQVMCLLGPSGCGKSTTLRIIAGVERQDAGECAGGRRGDLGRAPACPARGAGHRAHVPGLRAVPASVGGRERGLRAQGPKAEKRARVEELLARVKLARHIDAYPHQLSGGEQQRVALARAIAPRPRVMLMDEPFSGLDNRLRDGVRDETLEILKEEGAAVLLVTHEPEEAMRMADEIALMRAGRIVQRGAPYNVYNAPVDRNAAAFFSDINVIRGVVHGALTDTPFGQFLAPGVPGRTEVEIVIRPQHLRIDFDRNGRGPNPTPQDGIPARAVVERARYMGHESLVELRLEHDGRDPEGDGAVGLPAEAGDGALADDPARAMLRLSR
jgi:iron(III) transport system ATP-binding protein